MELNNIFSENFNFLFNDLNISISKFSALIGIDRAQISNYLNGRLPRTTNIIKICDYFNCSVDYITGLNDNFNYKNNKKGMNIESFYKEYISLLKANNKNHFQLSQKRIVCMSSLRLWKLNKLPRFDVIYQIAVELGGSIDSLLGRI